MEEPSARPRPVGNWHALLLNFVRSFAEGIACLQQQNFKTVLYGICHITFVTEKTNVGMTKQASSLRGGVRKMKFEKVKKDDVKKRMAHAYRTKKDIEYLLDRGLYMGKSKIDPSMTDMNVSVGCSDIRAEYDKDVEMTYHQKDSVVMHELIITYPAENPPMKDGVVVPPKEFFDYVVKALQNDAVFGKHFKFYGGCVHFDETSVHMHGFLSSIEKLDKPITKVVGVKKVEKLIKSTGKTRIVEQRIKKSYDQQYNAKKMMSREFFKEFHYMMEDALGEMGVKVELISKEVREFNAFKKKLEAEYKEKIEKAGSMEEKQALLHEMFVILQGKDPKKTHKAIQEMYVEDFAKQLEEIKVQEKERQKTIITEMQEKHKTVITELEKQHETIYTELSEENETIYTDLARQKKNLKKELNAVNQKLEELHRESQKVYERELRELNARVKKEIDKKSQEIYEEAYNNALDQQTREIFKQLGMGDVSSTFPAQERNKDDR